MAELTLASDFPPVGEADWRALVEKALKGAPFETLQSRTYDGNVIEPLYAPAAEGAPLAGRPARQPWTVMQRIDIADPKAANAQILDDLYNGAPGLSLIFSGGTGDYGYTLEPSKPALAAALKDVLFDKGIEIELNFGPASRQVADIIAELVTESGADLSDVKLRFGYDQISAAAMGLLPDPGKELSPGFVNHVGEFLAAGFRGPFSASDGRVVHSAGGSEAQELAFVLASAVAYLRAYEAGGIDLEQARDCLYFRLVADQNQFLTLAKFRALRKLWARIEQACGLEPKPVFVSAETAWRMMAKRDAYGNMIRTTIACAAAALGGADAIAVLPYTAALGIPRDHARRVARNTQLILMEESNLHQVADPAAGSGALETFTQDLCRTTWTLFQEIELAGGAAEALRQGLIQKRIAETRAERDKNVARRKETIIGTSDFPDLDEATIEIDPLGKLPAPSSSEIEPLRHYRLAEPFEALRDASDAALAETGKRPAIFIATLGRPADFTARATFARSLFAAGGVAPILPEKPATNASGEAVDFDVDSLVAEFRASGERLACLCSSDRVYAEAAEQAARALKQAGARHVYLAGKPKEPEALERAGVDGFIFQGCDTLSVLADAQRITIGER